MGNICTKVQQDTLELLCPGFPGIGTVERLMGVDDRSLNLLLRYGDLKEAVQNRWFWVFEWNRQFVVLFDADKKDRKIGSAMV